MEKSLLKTRKWFIATALFLVFFNICDLYGDYDIQDTRSLYSQIIYFGTSSGYQTIPFQNTTNEMWSFDATAVDSWATVEIEYHGYRFPVSGSVDYDLPAGCVLEISVLANSGKGRVCHLVAESTNVVFDIKILQSGNSYYSGGYGTVGYPYLISTSYDIIALSLNNPDYNKYFSMINDISLDGMLFTSAIFASDTINNNIFDGVSFSGVFDGGGYALSNFDINSSGDYVGVFGYTSGSSTIKNLSIDSGNVRGEDYIGGLCGANGGTLKNCSVNNSLIVGDKSISGGVVGLNNGLVQMVEAVVDVQGVSISAGLVGYNTGEIAQSYSFADVSCGNIASGLVAWNTGLIQNCYNYGSVTGTNYTAGLLAINYGGMLKYSYTLSQVAGTTCFGAVVATNLLGGVVLDCAGQNDGFSKQQMQSETTYTTLGWDFINESANGEADIWLMQEYPKLRCFKMSYMGWISLQVDDKYVRGYYDNPAGDGISNMKKYMFDLPAMEYFQESLIKSSTQITVESNDFAVSYYKSNKAQDCEIYPQSYTNGWQKGGFDLSLVEQDGVREKLSAAFPMTFDIGYVQVSIEVLDLFTIRRKAIMLGDGVTSGSWPTEGDTWPERFDWLRPDLTGLNLGDSRTHASFGADHINYYMYTYDPEYVLVLYGINDIAAGISVSDIKSELRYIVEVVLGYGKVPILGTIPVVPTYTSSERVLARSLNAGIKQIGVTYDIEIADVATVLDNDSFFMWDGLHPTRRGQELIALEFFKTMQLDICK